MSTYIIGIDLGQLSDRTALSVLRRDPPPPTDGWWGSAMRDRANRKQPPAYDCLHLQVWMPGTRPADIIETALRVIERVPRDEGRVRINAIEGLSLPTKSAEVFIDITVAGKPVGELFRRAFEQVGIQTTFFTITGGTNVERQAHEAHVPKRDLASVLRALLDTNRLRVTPSLQHRDVLIREMQNFRIEKITNDDTIDWRERENDDLVLAVAMACWQHEHGRITQVAWARSIPGSSSTRTFR